MFEQAPEWISRSPRIRKVAGKIWRAFLRVQRGDPCGCRTRCEARR